MVIKLRMKHVNIKRNFETRKKEGYAQNNVPSIFCRIFFTFCAQPSQSILALRTQVCKETKDSKTSSSELTFHEHRNITVTTRVL